MRVEERLSLKLKDWEGSGGIWNGVPRIDGIQRGKEPTGRRVAERELRYPELGDSETVMGIEDLQ